VFWDTGAWSTDYGKPQTDGGGQEASRSSDGSVTLATPLVLARNIPAPMSIAVDDTLGVFYASSVSDGGIYRCSPNQTGCIPFKMVSNLATPGYIAIGPPSIFWSNLSGGTIEATADILPMPRTYASNQEDPTGVAYYGAEVYWAAGGTIMSCSITGCPDDGGSPIVVAAMEQASGPVAADATGVYWGTWDLVEGHLRFCGSECTQPKTLATIPGGAASIVLYDGVVYWSSQGDTNSPPAITSCSESDCTPVLIWGAQSGTPVPISSAQSGIQIAVDGTGIYWTEPVDNGSVLMCPTTGCPAAGPRVLTTLMEGTPYAIALDPSYVYFTDTRNSTILRIPKPAE
jgi:hypothetical protein